MKPITLIHPIYLDVPMMVSFAAALEGGLSFGSETVHEKSSAAGSSVNASGKFGLSELFSSLFTASAELDAGIATSQGDNEVRKESRSHTEASIAILLYDRLRQTSELMTAPSDVSDLAALQPGALVELHGTMFKNPVDATIDYIDAMTIMGEIAAQFANAAAPSNEKGASHKQAIKQFKADPKLVTLKEGLSRDRKRTPISSVQLRCTKPAGLTAVVTLRTQNLRDLTMSELHRNAVRVVGKVTRTVPSGSSMGAFENYGMGLMKADKLREMFANLTAIETLEINFSDVVIEGPAVQVLPLMVFV